MPKISSAHHSADHHRSTIKHHSRIVKICLAVGNHLVIHVIFSYEFHSLKALPYPATLTTHTITTTNPNYSVHLQIFTIADHSVSYHF